ncbi:PTS sugar transporter subunit IIA [Poriferisphaera sp. WC338]|uniref:PTS sugar transporter subunit IIA n=1 Tax=Poriferisphaera sp. WC338 TaxID=3425129 RepID=UPI003D8153E6
MRLTDILQPDCVIVPIKADGKEAAIYALADQLSTSLGISDGDALKDAIWEREMTRTTGMGNGIAIPHGKSPGVQQLCMAAGIPENPLDFQSIDGKPVNLIFLLASPVDQTGPHIQALAKVCRMLTNEAFRTNLQNSATPDEMYNLIAEYEADAPA